MRAMTVTRVTTVDVVLCKLDNSLNIFHRNKSGKMSKFSIIGINLGSIFLSLFEVFLLLRFMVVRYCVRSFETV